MLQNEIIQYFQDKGLKYKNSGNQQFVVQVCPACGDDKFHHVYMNQEEGLWDCKKCGVEGNFNQFMEFYGDEPLSGNQQSFLVEGRDAPIQAPVSQPKSAPVKVLNNAEAIDCASRLWATKEEVQKYLLEERGLDKDVLETFKVGVDTKGRITIPLYEDAKLVNFRYRKNPKDTSDAPKYTQESGCKSVLFNGDILGNPNVRNVYLTEGEFDAMQLIQRGFSNVVSVTLGATSFKKDWAEKFDQVQKVYICYDNDTAGVEGANKVSSTLGEAKCKIVQLPKGINDITEFFQKGKGKKDFLDLVKNAKSSSGVGIENIKHISEFNEELRERLIEGEYFGIETGYAALDDLMGGLRKGRLIVVSGLTSVGKTSFSINMALNLAEMKEAVYFLSLEMTPIDIVKKVLMLKAQLTNQSLKDIEDPSVELEKVDETLEAFKSEENLPMYLYSGSSEIKKNVLTDSCRLAVNRFGAKCIFIDHLHYFVTNYNNLTAETSRLVREIKLLAMELDVPIVLLCHLNRGGRQKQRKGLYMPSLSDLRDSGAIEQDADQVIFVCRDSENEDEGEREKSIIKLAKNRDGAAGRSVSMKFDEGINTFIESVGVDYLQESESAKETMEATIDMPTVEDEPSDKLPF